MEIEKASATSVYVKTEVNLADIKTQLQQALNEKAALLKSKTDSINQLEDVYAQEVAPIDRRIDEAQSQITQAEKLGVVEEVEADISLNVTPEPLQP